ncbi:MAG TPA: S49 family peptidase, partial [Candidatus Eisenbacteria bacterium]|nr:S49 family peptidase [Candidatus Eisenbacteria bacterium]
MASRGRVALIALGAGAGVLVLFVFTVWLILAVSDDGLPGGAKVAVVEVEGVIGVGAERGLDTESIIRTLGEYRDDPAVRAVVLRIDSPGGVVAPTQEIFTAVRRLREAKKPVVASLGSVAASGGYYVAVSADRIFASPGTLTGSIGVVMQLANVEGLLKKVGV